jgi:L-alanine-DL-glutamate epimerase-like enolase superfamily enzyme
MKIESVDFFYLSMPEILDIGDGSQDALLVRVTAGGHVGWGECEASPLVSIAALVCPMSHAACKPVEAAVLGQELSAPQDIARITARVEWESMDLLQAAHTFSGIEMALWDILGKARGEPAWRLLGYERAFHKRPYASQLFGDTPEETLKLCRGVREKGYVAVKCGWGPFGRGSLKDDREHLAAAREGIGAEGTLLIDAGQIWGDDVAAAEARLSMLEEVKATWLEEPFNGSAYDAYGTLAKKTITVKLAGGEASHNYYMAEQLIKYGGVGFIQIDCGRIGGLGPAKRVADYAVAKGVTYVNHTFTSHLALSASLQPFAGLASHRICEYPVTLKSLAWDMTRTHLLPDTNGEISLPDAPGLGIEIDLDAVRRYLVDVEIKVCGKTLFSTVRP